jgi:hypothetical protein
LTLPDTNNGNSNNGNSNNAKNNKTRLLIMPGLSHFDAFDGEAFQVILKETVSFFKEHLL